MKFKTAVFFHFPQIWKSLNLENVAKNWLLEKNKSNLFSCRLWIYPNITSIKQNCSSLSQENSKVLIEKSSHHSFARHKVRLKWFRLRNARLSYPVGILIVVRPIDKHGLWRVRLVQHFNFNFGRLVTLDDTPCNCGKILKWKQDLQVPIMYFPFKIWILWLCTCTYETAFFIFPVKML